MVISFPKNIISYRSNALFQLITNEQPVITETTGYRGT